MQYPLFSRNRRLRLLLLSTGLAAALGLSACAAQQQQQQEGTAPAYKCDNEAMTGSNVARPTCRPLSGDQQRRADDQEAIRRAQEKTGGPRVDQ